MMACSGGLLVRKLQDSCRVLVGLALRFSSSLCRQSVSGAPWHWFACGLLELGLHQPYVTRIDFMFLVLALRVRANLEMPKSGEGALTRIS